ncbi:hypothetical protein [Pseudofrankia sp. DC12]|uniref:hypothetical protein n=1 Tax=Pseudofrankia sp. DC12 TaxID=683315 RepID=UPI0005F829C1|nr:hypothetical protein [Pseudofrankia sp. DC12]
MTTVLALAVGSSHGVIVAAWRVAAARGPRSVRHRWAGCAAVSGLLLAVASAQVGTPGGEALGVAVGVAALGDWWRTRPPRTRRRRRAPAPTTP